MKTLTGLKEQAFHFIKDKQNSFYDSDHLYNAMSFDLGTPTMDEGAIERALEKNLSVLKVWDSHDMIAGAGDKPLAPIDMNDKEGINFNRVNQEVGALLNSIFKDFLEIQNTMLNQNNKSIKVGKIARLTNYMFITTFQILYQDVKKLPISDEHKEIFQEYIKFKATDFLPKLIEDQAEEILSINLNR